VVYGRALSVELQSYTAALATRLYVCTCNLSAGRPHSILSRASPSLAARLSAYSKHLADDHAEVVAACAWIDLFLGELPCLCLRSSLAWQRLQLPQVVH
jgi:hypothetical protein